MLGFKSTLTTVLFSVIMLIGTNAYAVDTDTTTTTVTQSPTEGKVTKVVEVIRHEVVTPVPEAKDPNTTPEGYVSCFTVEAGWYNSVWIDKHRVCQYNETQKLGSTWVAGYWSCMAATADGVCTSWAWKAGHWDKTLVVY